MIECISTAVEAVKDLSAKVLDGRFLNDICPDFLKSTNEVPAYQIEAAAHSACRFFDMPDAPLIEGDSIGVYTLNPDYLDDDVFQYNIPQFKDMNLYSFEDQTKVWTHECGHRILQKMYGNSWASELGSDFFVGVREEMLGMGSSNFEKTLGATKASHSHPGGKLRIEAIKYGREVAAEMKKNGIAPTWQNCIEHFEQSKFAKMTFENSSSDFHGLFVNDSAYHEREARRCREEAKYYMKESNRYAEKGDLSKSNEMLKKAQSYEKEAENHCKSMAQCTK